MRSLHRCLNLCTQVRIPSATGRTASLVRPKSRSGKVRNTMLHCFSSLSSGVLKLPCSVLSQMSVRRMSARHYNPKSPYLRLTNPDPKPSTLLTHHLGFGHPISQSTAPGSQPPSPDQRSGRPIRLLHLRPTHSPAPAISNSTRAPPSNSVKELRAPSPKVRSKSCQGIHAGQLQSFAKGGPPVRDSSKARQIAVLGCEGASSSAGQSSRTVHEQSWERIVLLS